MPLSDSYVLFPRPCLLACLHSLPPPSTPSTSSTSPSDSPWLWF